MSKYLSCLQNITNCLFIFCSKELELQLEEATRQLDDTRNQLSVSERKRITIQQELEDARSLLEHVSISFTYIDY